MLSLLKIIDNFTVSIPRAKIGTNILITKNTKAMFKKSTPPTEYSAPRVEVLDIVSEQPIFSNSLQYGDKNTAGYYLDEDIDGGSY